MIKPTVGRVVWFWEGDGSHEQPKAAIITHVNTDQNVNLHILEASGESKGGAISVALCQPEDKREEFLGRFCEWMPFQKGQASKTEQLEAAAAKGST